MKKTKLLLALCLIACMGYAQLTTILNFNLSNGEDPFGSLYSDGTYLYGMGTFGGANSAGTIFKIKPDGSGYVDLLDFNGTNGRNPYGTLISDGTFLYGMTNGGGPNGWGTIFKIMPDGSGFTNLWNFNILWKAWQRYL